MQAESSARLLSRSGCGLMAPFPTFTDVLHARQIIAPWLPVTPLFSYPQLDQALGFTLFLKHENYQPVGAFKVRGGITFMAQLPEAQRRRGVVTASTGNHGQSVAFAARLFGVGRPATNIHVDDADLLPVHHGPLASPEPKVLAGNVGLDQFLFAHDWGIRPALCSRKCSMIGCNPELIS